MHVFEDNVREVSTTEGTGNITTAGATAPVSTGAIGRAFSAVLNTNDTFDYVIHHRTLNEWEVGKGTYIGPNEFRRDWVTSSSNSDALVNFSAGTKVVWIGPTSWLPNYAWDVENIKNHNAVNGQDNTARISAARTAAGVNKPILAPHGTSDWGVISTLGNLGIDASGQGTLFTASQGTEADPSTASNALIRLEKYTDASDSNGQSDHGGIDVRVKKVAGTGTNNAYASYFYMEHDSDGTAGGCLYAVKNTSSDIDRLYGFNAYVDNTILLTGGIVKGAYFNLVDSSGQDNGWQDTYAAPSYIGIELAFTGGRGQHGYLTQSGGAGTGWYTGFLFAQDSILPSSFDTYSEAMRIQGASSGAGKYKGIWFQKGYFTKALDLVGPTYEDDSAILFPKDTYITFGTASGDTTRMKWTSTNLLDLSNGTFGVNGSQVVGARVTGWAAPTGTASRNTFATNTVTTEELAQRVKALIDDLTTHGLIGT